MERRSKRSLKQVAAIKVEEVFVKEEPDAADLEPEVSEEEISVKPSKRVYIRSKGTQVNFDEILKESDLPTASEPILSSDLILPQCRFCLHRMSTDNMKRIYSKEKSKANTVFRLKVFVNDSYPYACFNCLNLIDLIITFKETVLKANHMLQTERTFVEAAEWQDPSVMKLIADCKSIVDQNHAQIDSLYQPKVKKCESEVQDSIKGETVPPIEQTLSETSMQGIEEEHLEENIESDVYIEHLLEDSIPDGTEDTVTEEINEPEPEPDPEPNLEDACNDDDDDFEPAEESEDDDYKPISRMLTKIKKPRVNHVKPDNEAEGSPKKKRRRRKTKASPESTTKTDYRVLCDLCGAKMYSTTAESHRNQHLGIKPYSCQQCPLTFHSQYNLSFHMKRTHAKIDERRHECDICGSVIMGPLSALKYHKKRHDQEKKYFCTICGKGFTMPGYLTQHVQAHGDFPHKCQYCGKRFNLRASMRTHEKNMHEKKMLQAQPESQS